MFTNRSLSFSTISGSLSPPTISLDDKLKSESLSFLNTSLCDNFIDLTAASSESSSNLEIPEIDVDSLVNLMV